MIEVDWDMVMTGFLSDMFNLLVTLGSLGVITLVTVLGYLYLKDWWDNRQ